MVTSAGVEVLGPFSTPVNYDADLEKMILSDNYDVHDPRITSKNFPPRRTGKAKLDIYLVCFGKPIATRKVNAELRNMKMRAAELPEVLAWAKDHPDLQRTFPIVAAGTVWIDHSVTHSRRGSAKKPDNSQNSDRYMPCLWGLQDQRALNLNLLGATFEEAVNKEWQPFCRFAAVLLRQGDKSPGE